MKILLSIALLLFLLKAEAQIGHSHNDYLRAQPLMEAIANGLSIVEADVHLIKSEVRIGHDRAAVDSPSLNEMYFHKIDSLVQHQSVVLPLRFFLMVDIKTNGDSTWKAIRRQLVGYPSLQCSKNACRVMVFVSGNRPVEAWSRGDSLLILDGRPSDLGKNIPVSRMPVISDRFNSWSSWNGQAQPAKSELERIRQLASKVHAENRLLRLWAIPDNEMAWRALIEAGVDIINTDKPAQFGAFAAQSSLHR